MAILRDYYDTGGNWNYKIYGSEWKGQTFTTSSAYTLSSVSLSLARSGTPGTLTVSIFATSGGKPTGSVLTSNTYDGNSLSDSVYTWIDIQLTPYSLSSGVQYAIVVKATSGNSSNFVYWIAESGMPSYSGGSQVWSSDSGSSWTTQGNNDQYFRTYSAQNITFGEYIDAGSSTTKLLLHLNGSSTDSSGNGNNGTDTNITYSLANGKLGQGASLNGTSSYINLGNGASLNFGTGSLTISCWIKTTDGTGALVTKRSNGGSGFQTYVYNNYIYADGAGTNGSFGTQVKVINDDVWHNCIFVYDRTAGYLKCYVDGTQDGITALDSTTLTDASINCLIGKQSVGGSFDYYAGLIDEVILENRAWTASEIKKYYTNSLGRF